jgi:hypothetical protein
MIVKRVMKRRRATWPDTHLIRRGDGHVAHPERMAWVPEDSHADCLGGLSHNAVLKARAPPVLTATRRPHEGRTENARCHHQSPPTATSHELDYAVATWPPRCRVVLQAEVMALGDHPRFVVTSLDLPAPQRLYRELYGARGQDENGSKRITNDLPRDRTAAPRFWANPRRLFFAGGAEVRHHARRAAVLIHPELAQAQPATGILKRFKIAVRVVPYKDRLKRHRPSAGPIKALLQRVTEILFLTPAPLYPTS